jgi:putative transposase
MREDHYPTAYVKAAVEAALNALMDAEVSAMVQADHYQRSGTRTAYRNGYRVRRWRTDVGTLVLHIPKLRSGSYYPAFLSDESDALALLTQLAEDALLGRLDESDVFPLLTDSQDEVAAFRFAAELRAQAEAFLTRRLPYPYPTLVVERDSDDNLFFYGERHTGTRHLLDIRQDTTSSAYWQSVLRDLTERGLTGVETVDGDGLTESLRRAIRQVMPNTSENHKLANTVTVALGLPFERTPIDRRKPRLLLDVAADAVLTTISTANLQVMRRMMRRRDDAVAEETVAA